MKSLRRLGGVVVLVLIVAMVAGIALTWAPDRTVYALEPRWGAPPSGFIKVDGMPVHVRDEGPRDDRHPIVLLHGTAASLHTWEGWAAALRDKHRVIRVDLPGFGLTGPNRTGDYSVDADASFVLHLLDALHVPTFTLGGNSLGGEIAWHVAAAAPERVDRLILVDAGGYPLTPTSVPIGFRIARNPVLSWITKRILPRSVISSSVRNVYGDQSRVTDSLVDRYYELTLRDGNRDALGLRFAQWRPGADADRIKSLKVPTLILWGGRDRLIPPEHARQFARDIAGSTLVMYDDLGHVPQEEDPARTVADVLRFIAR